jgi:hypothetical protein
MWMMLLMSFCVDVSRIMFGYGVYFQRVTMWREPRLGNDSTKRGGRRASDVAGETLLALPSPGVGYCTNLWNNVSIML